MRNLVITQDSKTGVICIDFGIPKKVKKFHIEKQNDLCSDKEIVITVAKLWPFNIVYENPTTTSITLKGFSGIEFKSI